MNNTEIIYVFGYGSLMNDESRLRSAPESTILERNVRLEGYQRIFNIAYDAHVYANIEQNDDYIVAGTLMSVSPKGFQQLKLRERNYEAVDISNNLIGVCIKPVYAFIGCDNTQGGETVKQSYIDLCLSAVAPEERGKWLEETTISLPIQKAA